jgi:hypothetical protein
LRAFAWGCFVAGTLLAIATFVITANTIQNPWPALMAGFFLTALGVVLLAVYRNLRP